MFSNTATRLVNDAQADLVKNLQNLEPTIKALADVGPEFGTAIAASFVFPFTQNFVDRAVRGDYFNLHVDFDLTIPRLKKGLLLGTHWGQLDMPVPPEPGDPYRLNYTLDPLHNPLQATVGRSQCAAAASAAAGSVPGPPPGYGPRARAAAGCAPTPDAGLGQAPPPATAPRREVADRC